jgi:hypothetical protein
VQKRLIALALVAIFTAVLALLPIETLVEEVKC